MSEWLSNSEWCDVRLLCRGRVFSAHRAVLASVSSYLRCILMSHPEQDMPIHIVLPDFDYEAMSSVLYYVYNGEINLPLTYLSSFFDIITTLRIFVDKNVLDNIKNRIDNVILDNKKKEEVFKNVKTSVNNLTECSKYSEDLVKITFRAIEESSAKYLTQSENHYSSLVPYMHNLVRKSQHYLENMQSQDVDRQRNCLLRDSFTEIYPQNGIVNRPLPDVTTITNECNIRVLPRTQINVNYDNACNNQKHNTDSLITISELYRDDIPKVIQNISYESEIKCYNLVDKPKLRTKIYLNELQYDLSTTTQDNMTLESLSYLDKKTSESEKEKCNNTTNSLTKPNCLRPVPILLPLRTNTSDCSVVCNILDLSSAKEIISPKVNLKQFEHREMLLPCDTSTNSIKKKYSKNVEENIQLRRKPLNEVLASPWTPRHHYTNKPLYIKNQNLLVIPANEKLDPKVLSEETQSGNDSNNNLQTSKNVATSCDESTTIKRRKLSKNKKSDNTNTGRNDTDVSKNRKNEKSRIEQECEYENKQSSKARHICGDCGKSFSQLRNYKYHVSVHRGTREFAATCSVCGKYFNDRGYLSSHMKIHRNRKEYQCPHCPKSFNQRVAYNMHIRIHTGVKPHVCGECGKAFSRKMLLRQHTRTHSGERPYSCTFCEKRFADRSNMTLHMRLHSGVKPFSCTLCSKSFTKKHHLKTHLNYHTGAKPYNCPRCKLAFSQSSNMRTHLKKCTASETPDT